MKTYPKYKNSGIDWIGDIPFHWSVKRAKSIFTERKETSTTGREELLSVSEYYGVARRVDKMEDGEFETRADTLVGYKICHKDDLVINIMLAWKCGLGFSNYNGIVSPAYAVYYGKDIVSRYFHYLLRTGKYVDQYKRHSKGIIDSRLRMYTDRFNNIMLIVPPKEEQRIIASYLDEKCGEIDRQVELLEKKQNAYERLKTSIINKAVTHGLNPDVPMRDSELDWIGTIPKDWNIMRIKDLGTLGSGTTPKSGNEAYYDEGTHPWLNTGCVQNCIINEPAKYVTDLAMKECSGLRYYPKDTILIAMYGGGTIGNVGLMGFDATINQACCAIELSNQHKPKFLFYAIMAQNAKLISNGFGGTQINLSLGQIANFLLAVPPLEEQQRIADYLDDKCSKIDSSIENICKQIDAYKRLKKSLINEVVTGKRAV